MMKAVLYGIGVGPGDSELMTLKAINTIKNCDIIAIPSENIESCVAYNIAKGAVSEIINKDILKIHMPMTKDKTILLESHNKGCDIICEQLNKGKTVGFLTLGDPTIYSTYMYIHKSVKERGYKVSIINGIPSFIAVAAKLDISLVENKEELHIIPATYTEEIKDYKGTTVLMKSGKKIADIKKMLEEKTSGENMVKSFEGMIENCTMDNEKITLQVENIDELSGYYSTIILKSKD
jgi:precorrin-2 C20-methyltransferase